MSQQTLEEHAALAQTQLPLAHWAALVHATPSFFLYVRLSTGGVAPLRAWITSVVSTTVSTLLRMPHPRLVVAPVSQEFTRVSSPVNVWVPLAAIVTLESTVPLSVAPAKLDDACVPVVPPHGPRARVPAAGHVSWSRSSAWPAASMTSFAVMCRSCSVLLVIGARAHTAAFFPRATRMARDAAVTSASGGSAAMLNFSAARTFVPAVPKELPTQSAFWIPLLPVATAS